MSEDKLYLPKLAEDGSNWITYHDRMEWAMKMRGLGDHLTNASVSSKYTNDGVIATLTPSQRWAKDQAKASQLMDATIPDVVFHKIKATNNVKEVWDMLKVEFDGKSRSVMVDLGRKFQTTRCGDDEDVRAHFSKLAYLREQLMALGRAVSDDEYAAVLMGSLPPAYDGAIDSLTSSCDVNDKDVTPVAAIRAATREYEKRVLRKEVKSQEEAFAAAEADKKKPSKRKDVECLNCKKRGHVKADCWVKGGGDEGGGARRRREREGKGDKGKSKAKDGKDKANAAETEASSGDESWAVIVAVDDAPNQGESYHPQSALTDSASLTDARTEAELYDSGASRHMSPFLHRFTNLRTIPPRPITAANNRVFYATGLGDLKIDVPNGSSSTRIVLKDALYAPDMGMTVVSVGKIASAGCTVSFEGKKCRIKNKEGRTIGRISASANGLYRVDHPITAAAAQEQVDLLTVHRRLGHISVDSIRTLVRANAVTGLQIIDPSSPISCDSCAHAKATRKTIRKESATPRAEAFGDEVHTDVWGPAPVSTLGGRKYYVTFTDDSTRYTRLEILRSKDETFQAYKTFAAWAKTQHGVQIKRLRSDRGGEYTGGDFTNFLKSQGTERRLTTHDTPQHNGVAESLNRRLLERVRAVLHHSGLPKSLWGEAVLFIVWLKNRVITRALGTVTPFEALNGSKPDLSGVPEWGQPVWVHVDSGSKLGGRAAEARWVGFDGDSTHAHRIYWQDRNRVSVERNIHFTPSSITVRTPLPFSSDAAASTTRPTKTQQQTASTTQSPSSQPSTISAPSQPQATPVTTATPSTSSIPIQAPPAPPVATDSGEEEMPEDEEDQVEQQLAPPVPQRATRVAQPAAVTQGTRKSMRQTKPSQKLRDMQAAVRAEDEEEFAFYIQLNTLIASATQDTDSDPKTLGEAQARSDWPLWKVAMDKEMDTLEKAKTWSTVPRPSNTNIVGSKWVFRIKRKADGSIDKYKARLVARGFTQIYGVDYFDTYSPVAKMASFRAILAIAARQDWEVESFDFNGAYLNGTLGEKEEIYMQEPPGYETQGERSVKRLLKSLYGLKQAGRKWYEALTGALADLGLRASTADPGVFLAQVESHSLILAIHVDDCILTGSSPDLIADYKRKFNARYTLTDLGPVHWFLGIKITRNRSARTLSLSQRSYIDTILTWFQLSDAKPYCTLMAPGAIYSTDNCPSDATEATRMRKVPYREAVGSLMYASVATRPDISHAVSTLSRFLNNPGPIHWEAVKRVFRYLAGTRDLALTYGGERHDLLGYTDADGTSEEHRHAISGYAFLFDGGAISWLSRKQEIVTLSTAEAEYVAATHAAKEAIWLRRLLSELLSPLTSPTTIHCDNQAAIKLAHDDNYHARTKHIDIRYHFIRQVIADDTIKLIFCPTDDMVADCLTKALPKWKVQMHACSLGLCI